MEERYENLRKSVNAAIKKLCNKIEEIQTEVKEWKAEGLKNTKQKCTNCACIKMTKTIENKVEDLQDKLSKIETNEEAATKKYDAEIDSILKEQRNNFSKITSLDQQIESLNIEQRSIGKLSMSNSEDIVQINSILQHCEKGDVRVNKIPSPLSVKCEHCDSCFDKWHELKIHLEMDYSLKYPCNVCQENYRYIYAISKIISEASIEKKEDMNVIFVIPNMYYKEA